MQKLLFFLATGSLCVIAAMSLFRLHLIESQYAAVALSSDPSSAESATTGEGVAATPVLFPYPPQKQQETSQVVVKSTTVHTTIIKATSTEASATEAPPKPDLTKIPALTDTAALNTRLRAATVNIVCTAPGSTSPASGTGVIIDPRGVILTNAHVGQYLLLAETNEIAISCVVRTGSPASDAYHAALLYISPRWIDEHAKEIRDEFAKGTGEHDYSLLRITSSATAKPLPESFAYVPADTEEVVHATGEQVLVASYPAGFLSGASALYNMQMVSTVASIQQLFTFSEAGGTADLISLGGIITAQQGSSGSGVIDGLGRLLAIIVTSSQADSTADRDLRAVTLFHINQSITEEAGKSLKEYLSGDLAQIQADFDKLVRPDLEKKLLEVISGSK